MPAEDTWHDAERIGLTGAGRTRIAVAAAIRIATAIPWLFFRGHGGGVDRAGTTHG